jgi:hypothetical protein
MSKLSERLTKKIKEELDINCIPETFRRTYAGRNQKAAGAFLCEMQIKDSSWHVASIQTASELVKSNIKLEADNDFWYNGNTLEIFGEARKE